MSLEMRRRYFMGQFCDSSWDAHKIFKGIWGRIESVC